MIPGKDEPLFDRVWFCIAGGIVISDALGWIADGVWRLMQVLGR